MAFVVNRNQQITLDDSTLGMSDRECRFLKKDRSEALSEHIFPRSTKNVLPSSTVTILLLALLHPLGHLNLMFTFHG